MAFKMKRSSVSLRSTSRIQPITTKLNSSSNQSPFRQTGNEEAEALAGNVSNSIVNGQVVSTSAEIEAANVANTAAETDDNYDDRNITSELSTTWEEDKIEICSPAGKAKDPARYNAHCLGEQGEEVPGTPGFETSSSLSETTGSPKSNILSPRAQNRNSRMYKQGINDNSKLIDKANRMVREAVRKGKAIPAEATRILSGQSLGNYDGQNIKMHTDGTAGSIMTGLNQGPYNGEGSGISEEDRNAELLEEVNLMTEGKTLTAEETKQIHADANAKLTSKYGPRPETTRVEKGMNLTDKSRRRIRKHGIDEESLRRIGGGENLVSNKEKKRLKELRAKLADAKPDSWKAKSLKRRIKKKGGEYSPAKMTVNVTRPSYKMGGFGSK